MMMADGVTAVADDAEHRQMLRLGRGSGRQRPGASCGGGGGCSWRQAIRLFQHMGSFAWNNVGWLVLLSVAALSLRTHQLATAVRC